MRYRLLANSGLRVSEAALGTIELSACTDFKPGGGTNVYPWELEASAKAHS